MLIHELTDEECRGVLCKAYIGRLACARADQPYVVPILLYFDERTDHLYSFSTIGRKIFWMRENPKVCVEVEEVQDPFHWTTVVAVGLYEELPTSVPAAPARDRALEMLSQRAEWWLPGSARLTSGPEHARPVVYRIHVQTMSGRRAARGGRR